jgi:hypothetical protein
MSTKLELSFTTKQIAYLAYTSCRSFFEEQEGRFGIHDSSPENEKLMKNGSGWLHWLENDFLSTLIMQKFCVARGYHASILVDERESTYADWVVWTDDPLDGEPASEVNFTTSQRHRLDGVKPPQAPEDWEND